MDLMSRHAKRVNVITITSISQYLFLFVVGVDEGQLVFDGFKIVLCQYINNVYRINYAL
jgi:hypothetical protein